MENISDLDWKTLYWKTLYREAIVSRYNGAQLRASPLNTILLSCTGVSGDPQLGAHDAERRHLSDSCAFDHRCFCRLASDPIYASMFDYISHGTVS